MRRLTLATRLALLFALIVAGAILAIYFVIVPPLQGSLRAEKLRALSSAAEAYSGPLERVIGRDVPRERVARMVRETAARANARVTVLSVVSTGADRELGSIAYDSSRAGQPGAATPSLQEAQFPAADVAVITGKTATATEPTRDGRIGEAARPLRYRGEIRRVVVLSDSLAEAQDTVDVVRRRFVVAGLVALALAAIAGYAVARALARRVQRLERAARRVASGDFSVRVETDAEDELGQLAATFDDMQNQLAQLESVRRRFIATASHELRTPIFSLGGFLELLADEELDEETRLEFVAQVRGQVERLSKLATELLDLSRMEAGSLELRPEPTDIGRLVRELSDEFTPALGRHRSAIRLSLPQRPLEAECDPDRVAQVMRILLDNAVVHTPEGTDVEVSVHRESGMIRMEVQDRGLGIERQDMTRIFEPFFKSDDAPGAGLGLAIARELTERMHGRLSVDSGPGSTTFVFELPT